MTKSGIYKIQSKIKPERIYIGSSVDIINRWKCHLNGLRKNKQENSKLQNHFNKYGESDLQFSVIVKCEKEDLIKMEQFFIDSYNPYFNIRKIANSNIGLKRSYETRQKLSISHLGKSTWNKGKKTKPLSLEHRIKISKGLTGRKFSIESRLKISKSNKGNQNKLGYKVTEETKLKISKGNKGKIHSLEQNKRHNDLLRGREVSQEIRIRTSNTLKGRKFTEEHKQHIKDNWVLRKQRKTIK
jgi:group I intron endonuclease